MKRIEYRYELQDAHGVTITDYVEVYAKNINSGFTKALQKIRRHRLVKTDELIGIEFYRVTS